MKELFVPENRLRSVLTGSERRKHGLYTFLTVLLFILGSFAFWETVYELSNIIGSFGSNCPEQAFVEIRRMFPMLLTGILYVQMGTSLFDCYRASGPGEQSKAARNSGIGMLILGTVIALWSVIGEVFGLYSSFTEGNPSRMYPLDVCVGGACFALIGLLFVITAKRKIRTFAGCGVRGRFRLFHCLSYVLAMAGFAAFVHGIAEMDFAHGGIFFNIMLLLNYFTAFAMAVVYRFVYCALKPELRKKASRRLGFGFLLINAVLFALFILSVQLENEAPNLNAAAVLPLDGTASMNIFTVLYGLNNLLAPLIAVLKGIFGHRKPKVKPEAESKPAAENNVQDSKT